jgi:serine phosphatase RsbU (regulator of sigma subunit)
VRDATDNRPEGDPVGHVLFVHLPLRDKNRLSGSAKTFSYMPGGDQVMNIQDVTFLERQKRELLKKQSRHQKDLEAAAEIQQSLLPRRFSMNPAFRFAWEFRPCETVGGDIFNVFPLGRPTRDCTARLSCHGVASSLVALSVYNFMHYQRSTLVDRTTGVIEVASPKDVLTRLDWEFPFFKFSKFFTIVYMVLELPTGLLTYANAGHPAPVAAAPDGRLEPLDQRGTIIGLEGFAPFEEYSRRLSPGEKVLLYSDGLVDFQNAAGDFFGEKRLLDVLSTTASRPVTEVVEEAGKALGRFGGRTKPRDDISLLGLEYLGPAA